MTPPSDRICPIHDNAIGSRVGWKTFSVIITIAMAAIIGCAGMGLTSLLGSTKTETRVDGLECRLDKIERHLENIESLLRSR